jgi:hypothetical protein
MVPRYAKVVLACVFVAYLVRRYVIDLRFPVPWPDEGSFLWQALAFRDHFSLFAPEVNPEREAMWMPPGFMVLEGLFFKIVPFSLSASRTLSALFVCGAVGCVFACLRLRESKFLFPLLAGLFLWCPIAGMAGNVARMEGLELVVLAVSFFLIDRCRAAALGVLLLAPLAHPNGLFGMAVGVPFFFFHTRGGARIVRRADLAVIGAAVLAWALYAFHVSQHWAAFVRDIGAQILFKRYVSAADGGAMARITEPVVWGSALALLVALVCARRARTTVGALGAFAGALLVQTVTAAGWLYEVYPAMAVLVASVVALESVLEMARLSPWPPQTRIGVSVAVALLLVAFDASAYLHNAFLERSLERATVIRKSLEPAYDLPADRDVIRRYLTSITPPPGSRPLAVQFLPDAEALLYEDLRGPTLKYVQQTFYEHRYDVVLLHDSAWFPPFVRDLELIKLVYAKAGVHADKVLYERDGTERWTTYQWP